MDRETRRRLEAWRAEAPDPHNAVVDDLFAGECDRAGFIKRATMFGLSVPAMSAALVAAGEAPMAFAKTTRGKAGGRLRIGMTPIPKGTLEPWTYQETAALQLGGISGEFLNRTAAEPHGRRPSSRSAGSRTPTAASGRTRSARA